MGITFNIADVITASISLIGAIVSIYLTHSLYKKKRIIDLDIENKSREVQSRLDVKLETIKLQLSSLQEKRINAMSELYASLSNIKDYTEYLMHPIKFEGAESNEEIMKKLSNFYNIFREQWIKNKFLFTKDLSDKIDNFYRRVIQYTFSYNAVSQLQNSNEEWGQKYDISKQATQEMHELLLDIEADIRKLIGVEYRSYDSQQD